MQPQGTSGKKMLLYITFFVTLALGISAAIIGFRLQQQKDITPTKSLAGWIQGNDPDYGDRPGYQGWVYCQDEGGPIIPVAGASIKSEVGWKSKDTAATCYINATGTPQGTTDSSGHYTGQGINDELGDIICWTQVDSIPAQVSYNGQSLDTSKWSGPAAVYADGASIGTYVHTVPLHHQAMLYPAGQCLNGWLCSGGAEVLPYQFSFRYTDCLPPDCDSLRVSGSSGTLTPSNGIITVDPDEDLTITLTGQGNVQGVRIYAARSSTNTNAYTENLYPLSEQSSSPLTIEISLNELRTNTAYSGAPSEDVLLMGWIGGTASFCSANPAETTNPCTNSAACRVTLTAQQEAQPVCNDTCTTDANCPSNLVCDPTSRRCRNSECLTEADCVCEAAPQCNDTCTDNNDCPSNLVCDSTSGRCRNSECPTEADCICSEQPPASWQVVKDGPACMERSGSLSIGTFTITVTNTSENQGTLTQIVDTLPTGFSYVTNSARVNGEATEPTVSGQNLTWSGSWTVAAGGTVQVTYQAQASASTPLGTGTNTIVITTPEGNYNAQFSTTVMESCSGVPGMPQTGVLDSMIIRVLIAMTLLTLGVMVYRQNIGAEFTANLMKKSIRSVKMLNKKITNPKQYFEESVENKTEKKARNS